MPKFLNTPEWYDSMGTLCNGFPIIETVMSNPSALPTDKNAIYYNPSGFNSIYLPKYTPTSPSSCKYVSVQISGTTAVKQSIVITHGGGYSGSSWSRLYYYNSSYVWTDWISDMSEWNTVFSGSLFINNGGDTVFPIDIDNYFNRELRITFRKNLGTVDLFVMNTLLNTTYQPILSFFKVMDAGNPMYGDFYTTGIRCAFENNKWVAYFKRPYAYNLKLGTGSTTYGYTDMYVTKIEVR